MLKRRLFQTITAFLLVTVTVIGMVGCAKGPKPIVVVWYPNESLDAFMDTRGEIGRLIEQATGRKVQHKTTTKYDFAIQALAEGSADIAMAMGAVGYVEAKRLNPKIDVLFVNADKNGKLDDAKYFSWICVNKADADKYMNGGVYSIDNVKGKSISFVTNSSTSGFSVPTDLIIAQFPADNLDKEKLGKAGFFKEVVFGQSHQGAAYNLVNGNVDVAAFCDTELATFIELKSGTESTVGAVYAVKQNAAAPFDKLGGKEFVLLAVAPVFNGPNAYNPKNLTKDEVKAIQDLFTSAAVTNNRKIFYDKAIDPQASGLYDISKSNGYVLVDDSWYNAYR